MEFSNQNDEKEELNDSKITKKSYIKFTKLNKFFLFPFICPVFSILCDYLPLIIFDKDEIKGKEFYRLILKELSYILGGIPFFISKCKQKSNKENNCNITNDKQCTNNNGIKYIYNDKTILTFNSKKFCILFVVLCILFPTNQLTDSFNKKEFHMMLYFIISIPFFSKYILKEEIYNHHYLSLVIASIGIIIAMITDLFKFEKDDIIDYILLAFGSICFSLFFVLLKYLINIYYISPFKFSFFAGIVTMIFTSFGFIIYSLIKYNMNK